MAGKRCEWPVARTGNGSDNVATITARLTEMADRRQPVEVILVLRGTLRALGGTGRGRWRLHAAGRRVVTFPAGAVVAVTPVDEGPLAGGSHPPATGEDADG